jgi:hypothetical protein
MIVILVNLLSLWPDTKPQRRLSQADIGRTTTRQRASKAVQPPETGRFLTLIAGGCR